MNAPHRFKSRIEGHRAASRRWVCGRCACQHDTKTKACGECGDSAIYYFASKKEARRFMVLVWELRDGLISDLEVHPRYELHAPGPDGAPVPVANYVADFRYVRQGAVIVEDVKATNKAAGIDPLFAHKRAHMRAEYGIELFCNSAR